MLLLRSTSESAASYIRTDQLDGETDWKLRKAVHYTQSLESDNDLFHMNAQLYAEKPKKDIYDFIGTFAFYDELRNVCSIFSLFFVHLFFLFF